jgi:hypothetical protein
MSAGTRAEKQAAARRALDPQVRADARRLVTEWNERQAPLLFSPTIGAAVAAQRWFLGSAAPAAAPRNRSTYAGSIAIPTRW